MRDAIDMRFWEAHHADFSAFLAEAIDYLTDGFERLVAIEFDAPWRRSGAASH